MPESRGSSGLCQACTGGGMSPSGAGLPRCIRGGFGENISWREQRQGGNRLEDRLPVPMH